MSIVRAGTSLGMNETRLVRPRVSSGDNWSVKSDQLTPNEGSADGRTSALRLHAEYVNVGHLFLKCIKSLFNQFTHKLVCL